MKRLHSLACGSCGARGSCGACGSHGRLDPHGPPGGARLRRRALLLAAGLAAAAHTAGSVAQPPAAAGPQAGPAAHGSAQAQRAPAARERFAQAYAGAGRPRVALWWNRQLSDRHSDLGREVSRLTAELSPDRRRTTVEASTAREGVAEPQRPARLAEREQFQLETELARHLLDAGVRLVDRSTMLRLAGAHKAGAADLDRQQLEMQALLGHADYLLEVLLSPDDRAPLGIGFRADLKEVRSGQLLGSAYLTGMPALPPPGPGHYVARPGGYELVVPAAPRPTVQDVGEALAAQLMQALAPRLPAARR